MFVRSTIRHLEEVAEFLGPKEVTFYSQDDKVKVPIGLTAANKQVPLMMHIKYKVKLLDPDFVIVKQLRLVTSVIGNVHVKAKVLSPDAVTNSEPKYLITYSKNKTSRLECVKPSC